MSNDPIISLQEERHPKQSLKAAALTYSGIVGGALTLLANSDGLVRLTHFAKVVVSSWINWTNNIWEFLFSFISLPIYKDVFMSFTLAVMLLSAGVGGQLFWRKKQGSTEAWFKLQTVLGWHFPIGVVILLIGAYTTSFTTAYYLWMVERYPDWHTLIFMSLDLPHLLPALYAFAYRWPMKIRVKGVIVTTVLVYALAFGIYFSPETYDPSLRTPAGELLVTLVYAISAFIIVSTVKPEVYVKRIGSILILFAGFIILNYLQEPFHNMVVHLFGS